MGEDHVSSNDGLALATYYGCTSAESITTDITWSGDDDLSAMAAVFSYTSTSPTTHYRSVGTGGVLYEIGTASCSASATVTFSGTLPWNVGEGDKLTIDVDGTPEVGWILTRDGDQQVTLQSALSGTYTNQDFKIERAYASLSAWETGRQANLVTNNWIEVATCYKDGVVDDSVTIDDASWETGENNYIKIYAPASQRHTGVAGTGFVLKPSTTTPGVYYSVIQIQEDYVRIEGIEIDGSTIDNGQAVRGIQTKDGSATSDIRIDKCLIHDLTSETGTEYPQAVGIMIGSGSTRITNTIIYDMLNTSTDADAYAKGMRLDGGATTTHGVYNNTIYNVTSTASNNTIAGIHAVSGTVTATNNYAGGTSGGASAYDFTGTMTQSYNMSSDDTADGTERDNKAPGDQFVSTTPNSENLHLKCGASWHLGHRR
jgi:hypothetical protein